jgi:DNA processing protein
MQPSDWVRLSILSDRVKPAVVPALERFGSADEFVAATSTTQAEALGGLTAHGRRVLSAVLASDCAPQVEVLTELGAAIVPYESDDYPKGLLDLECPPPCLFVWGDVSCLARRCVSIVGSRASSPYGLDMACRIAEGLAARGVCVISGIAVGVDAAAHQGALNVGGLTAAVTGCGIDVAYPRRNEELRRRIAESGGAVVTEMPPGTEPSRDVFPRRNRLVAALSLLTVVVGASESSGALITADWAAELGREVAGVPGSVRDPFNRGAHKLIRDGAHVVDSAESVFALIGLTGDECPQRDLDLGSLAPDERQVWGLLSHKPTHVDWLGDQAGLSPAALGTALTMLMARGLVEPRPGGCYVRAV